MKINRFSKKTAFSLFITLVCVILITLFMVSLLQSVSSENNSTRLYTTSMDLNRMSDSAVSLVQAQITAATSQSKSGLNSDAVAWASQPGMIRTYGTDGRLWKAFKLYSWENMVEEIGFNSTAPEQLPASDWSDLPAIYTDLNEPAGGTFPILDPSSFRIVGGSSAGQDKVKGAILYNGDPAKGGLTFEEGSAPMPVKWLYILQDGTMSIATEAAGDEAAVVEDATVDNPIVGRIAFWTDDESSKVNINTASQGTFWDIPRVRNHEDAWRGSPDNPSRNGFSTSVPVYNEFQRMPGHPATTSLSAVFGDLLPANTWVTDQSAYDEISQYYSLTPRVSAGGSEGGLEFVDSFNEAVLTLDPDRLYASAGEFVFNPEREKNHSKLGNPSTVSERRFFLTSQSRSPEENLFNKPRISIWPLQSEIVQTGVRNAKDRLIAFVSSLGGKEYHFQRYTAASYNGTKYEDIKKMATGTHSAASMDEDYQKLPRNQELLNYLSALSNSNIPGFGGSLQTKYPHDIEQIIVNSFDYLRSGTNLSSVYLPPNYNYGHFWANGDRFAGMVMPIRADINGKDVQGFGRKPVIQDASLIFFAADWVDKYTLGVHKIEYNGLNFDGDKSGEDHVNEEMAHHIFVGFGDFEKRFNDERDDYEEELLLSNPDIAELEKRRKIAEHMVDWIGNPDNVLVRAKDGIPDDISERKIVHMSGLQPPNPDEELEDANRFYVPHYDGIGDPQTAKVGAIFLFTPVVLNPGTPVLMQTLRYRVSGLDELRVRANSIPNYDRGREGGWPGSSLVTIPMHDAQDSVLTILKGASQTQDGMGLVDLFINGSTENGRRAGPSDGTHALAGRMPWVTPYDPTKGYLSNPGAPHRWKLNGSGEYILTPRNEYNGVVGVQTMEFSGATITIEIFPSYPENIAYSENDLIQKYTMEFPSSEMPLPQMYRSKPRKINGNDKNGEESYFAFAEDPDADISINGFVKREDRFRPEDQFRKAIDADGIYDHVKWEFDDPGTDGEARWQPDFYHGNLRQPVSTDSDSGHPWGSFGDVRVWSGRIQPLRFKNGKKVDLPHLDDIEQGSGAPVWYGATEAGGIFRRGDVGRTVYLDTSPSSPTRGDLRMIGNLVEVPEDYWKPHPDYFEKNQYQAMTLAYRSGPSWNFIGFAPASTSDFTNPPTNVDNWTYAKAKDHLGYMVGMGINYAGDVRAALPITLEGAFLNTGNGQATAIGDFDTGTGNMRDGSWIGKPDEGFARADFLANVYFPNNTTGITGGRSGTVVEDRAMAAYSPTRQVPSPVILGSLPTGVWSDKPWQTLLFNPIPAAGTVHTGFGSGGRGAGPDMRAPFTLPPDHVFLDNFFMPVSEPYPISERFSTSGKINLNYAMMPFAHIERSTGIHAVLQNARIAAIPNLAADASLDKGPKYKVGHNTNNGGDKMPSIRFEVDVEKTLDGFRKRFGDSGEPDIFRSASEVTTIYMVPKRQTDSSGFPYVSLNDAFAGVPAGPPSYDTTPSWWRNFRVTGDNLRESVYNQIYPRVTTKSNTFRVHYRVQTLQKRRAGEPTEWIEGVDRVMGEMRGSALIERYLDPNAQNIPDYAVMTDPVPLHNFYRWRVISQQQFRP